VKEILFIAYFFQQEDGVGSFRSRALAEMLKTNGYSINVISKHSFHSITKKNILLWGLFCLFRVLFSKERIVYVSCGPFLHLPFINLAAIIRRKQLVVDFRDPWSLNIKHGYGQDVKPNSLKLFIAESVEKQIYRTCTYFIVCTEGMYESYKALFNDGTKIVTIHNGHVLNEDVVHGIKEHSGETSIQFVCLGKFAEYHYDKALATLKKISALRDEGKKVSVKFIGSDIELTQGLIKEAGLEKDATVYPRLKYDEAISIARNSDVGLVVLRNEAYEIGTKIYDYIGMGIPVLDSFENGSNFKNKFNKYLFTDTTFTIPIEDRVFYSRENQYKRFLTVFSDLSS
jgi:hypothetical protein